LELNYEEAIVAFTKVIEIDPRNVAAYVGRGDAYVQFNEQLDFAKADYEKAIELDGANAEAYLGLVDVYIRMGEYDLALETARLGLEKTGDERLAAQAEALEAGNATDSSGNTRKASTYENGVLVWYYVQTYENGRRNGITTYDAAGGEISHVDILYNEQGEWSQTHTFTAGGVLNRWVATFDGAGNRVRCDVYNGDGEFFEYATYEYDGAGIVTKETRFEPDDTMKFYIVYENGPYGHIREDNFSPDGSLRNSTTSEYNDDGQRIKFSMFDKDGELYAYSIYEYGADGNMTKDTRYNADGTIDREMIYD
jgi:hypothetical protein